MNSKLWGTITWLFFHTLAEKIDENKFEKVKVDVINIIILVCNNLPCPDCSNHATEVLKKAYISNIQSKKHLIEFLRQFHNIVNIKIGKQEFTKEEIKEKYKNNNLLLLLNNMINVYKSIKTSNRLMSYNLQRNINLNKLFLLMNNIKYALL
tara:strand:- start:85 stop:540 length:456 start_codon:yes stop_codon:yes gene_type:complete